MGTVEEEDRKPQPSDGPEYHAEHAAWERRRRALMGAVTNNGKPVPVPSPLLSVTDPDACNCDHAGLPEGFHAKNCPARVPVPEPSEGE